jgi:phosphatidylglycerophosphatase C
MRPLAVFDFDHTITSYDSAARFFIWLIRRSACKCAIVLCAFPLLGPLFLLRLTQKIPIRFGAWIATLGLSHEQLADHIFMHLRSVANNGDSLIRPAARERINFHLHHGHDVVVATGSLELLARAILDSEGLSGIAVVGSSMRKFLGGMVVHEHCIGKQKIPMLRARGYFAPWEFAYTDHWADLPLLSHAVQRFIVNPRPKCAERFKAQLDPKIVWLTWI